MIDLALKMLLDEKARFAATVLGVGFAAALVLVQVGLFFGLLENASITIDRLDADLWITARNTPNVDFGNPFPESYVQRVRSVPGVARADNLIVWYAIVALADRGQGVGRLLRAGGLPGLAISLGRRVGRPGRPPPRPVRDARRLGRAAVRPVPASATTASSRAAGSRSSAGPARRCSFTTSPIAFLDYRLAQSLSPDELDGRTTFIVVRLEPGADAGGRPARDPPPPALQRRLHAGRVGGAVARLLDREHRAGADALPDRGPGRAWSAWSSWRRRSTPRRPST